VWGPRNIDTWARRVRRASWLVVGIRVAWTALPAILLAAFPQLLAAVSGRVFSYHALYRAMPAIVVWLTLSALLGLALGGGRVRALLRPSTLSVAGDGGTDSRPEE
jgi:hypothetical protein